MPVSGFLKIDDIPGESQRVDHEEEIDIHDIAWGVEQTRSASVGRGRARARSERGPLRIRKSYDAASPYLALAVDQGRSFPDAVISLHRTSGEAHLDYLVITLQNIVLSAYSFGPDSAGLSDDGLVEEVEIVFESIKFEYRTENGDTVETTLEN